MAQDSGVLFTERVPLGAESRSAAHLGVGQLAEIGRDVEQDALPGAGQRHSSEEQDDEHDVGIRG